MTPATLDSIPSANTRAAAGARRSFTRRDARLPSRQRPHLNVNMLAQVRKLDPAARLLISPCAPYPARHPLMSASNLASRGPPGDWHRHPRMSTSSSAPLSRSGNWALALRMAASSLASRGRSCYWHRHPRMAASSLASRGPPGDWHWHPRMSASSLASRSRSAYWALAPRMSASSPNMAMRTNNRLRPRHISPSAHFPVRPAESSGICAAPRHMSAQKARAGADCSLPGPCIW